MTLGVASMQVAAAKVISGTVRKENGPLQDTYISASQLALQISGSGLVDFGLGHANIKPN